MDRFLPPGCLNEAAPYTIHIENGVEKHTTVEPDRAPHKTQKEITSERLDEELKSAVGKQAGQVRAKSGLGTLAPPGRKGTSLNPNESYLLDFVDDSSLNKQVHEAAVAIFEGLLWKPWKGCVLRTINFSKSSSHEPHCNTKHIWDYLSGDYYNGGVYRDGWFPKESVSELRVWTGSHWEEPPTPQAEQTSLPQSNFPKVSVAMTKAFNVRTAAEFKGKKLHKATIAELNEACKRYMDDPVGEKDSFLVTVWAFTRISDFFGPACALVGRSPETNVDEDDILNNFALDLIDRTQKGQYKHQGRFEKWAKFVWSTWFFPEVQTEHFKYLNQTTFINPLDEEDEGFEFQDHCKAQSDIQFEQAQRENEGYSVPISGDRILRDLDDPNTPLGRLKPTVKAMLRGIAAGRNQKECAVDLGVSEKTIRRWMKDVRNAGRETLQAGVLPKVNGCADESNLLPWPEENSFDIQACAEESSAKFLTAEQAAAYLGGLNSRTLTRWAREGYIPAIPIGEGKRRLWRFLRTDLESWMISRRQGGQNAA